jgi:hypothetical protein
MISGLFSEKSKPVPVSGNRLFAVNILHESVRAEK